MNIAKIIAISLLILGTLVQIYGDTKVIVEYQVLKVNGVDVPETPFNVTVDFSTNTQSNPVVSDTSYVTFKTWVEKDANGEVKKVWTNATSKGDYEVYYKATLYYENGSMAPGGNPVYRYANSTGIAWYWYFIKPTKAPIPIPALIFSLITLSIIALRKMK